jgi:hypothetical protein
MGVVQKILRDSDVRITEGVYGHLDSTDVRRALAMNAGAGRRGVGLDVRPGSEVAHLPARDLLDGIRPLPDLLLVALLKTRPIGSRSMLMDFGESSARREFEGRSYVSGAPE